jgi:hypothetical protein
VQVQFYFRKGLALLVCPEDIVLPKWTWSDLVGTNDDYFHCCKFMCHDDVLKSRRT